MALDGIIIIGLALFWLALVVGGRLGELYRERYWAGPASVLAFGVGGDSWGGVWLWHAHNDDISLLSPHYLQIVSQVGTTLLCIGMVLTVLGAAGLCLRKRVFRARLNWHVRHWQHEQRFNEWCDHVTPLERQILLEKSRYLERLDMYMPLRGVDGFGSERWRLSVPVMLSSAELRRIAREPVSPDARMTPRQRLTAHMRAKYLSPKSWLRDR